MKVLAWVCLILTALPCGCGVQKESGSFSISISWDSPPVGEVWIWTRVEERSTPTEAGKILASQGPQSYELGDSLALEMTGVTNGSNRCIVAEVRGGANSSLPILYYGLSESFTLEAGKQTHVDVPMALLVPEAQAIEATLELAFGEEARETASAAEIKHATISTRSVQALSILLANDASFSANAMELSLDGEGVSCVQEEEDGLTWDVCQIAEWDRTAGLPADKADQQYTLFARFVDRYGYESSVYRASVVLDSQGPLVLLSSLTPMTTHPGADVFLSVTFHEALAEGEDSAALHVSPPLPEGSAIEGPVQIGNSTAYLWTLSLADDWSGEDSYGFAVDTIDFLGNEVKGQPLLDPDGAALSLNVDPGAPKLVQGAGEGFSAEMFGLPDVGSNLSFQFVIAESDPHETTAAAEGCLGICPTVRLGSAVLGTVFREPGLDDEAQGHVGFSFEYQVDPADFAQKDTELSASVLWSDKAGNTMEELVEGVVRFDFQPPGVLSCSLLPETGNKLDTFTYTVTATEVLAGEPELKIDSESGGLFAFEPEVKDDGQTYFWQQAASEMPSQS